MYGVQRKHTGRYKADQSIRWRKVPHRFVPLREQEGTGVRSADRLSPNKDKVEEDLTELLVVQQPPKLDPLRLR